MTYEIRYTGAPYGLNERGHVVSRHRTATGVAQAFRRAGNAAVAREWRVTGRDGGTLTATEIEAVDIASYELLSGRA